MAKDPTHDEELEEEYTEELSEEEYTEDEEGLEEGSAPAQGENKPGEAKPAPVKEVKPVKADEVPLDVVVEVGHFKITVQKLSELKPGDILDLNFRPEEGVQLVANGHYIAKGELLKIGDLIGVRILDIAG